MKLMPQHARHDVTTNIYLYYCCILPADCNFAVMNLKVLTWWCVPSLPSWALPQSAVDCTTKLPCSSAPPAPRPDSRSDIWASPLWRGPSGTARSARKQFATTFPDTCHSTVAKTLPAEQTPLLPHEQLRFQTKFSALKIREKMKLHLNCYCNWNHQTHEMHDFCLPEK